VVNPRSSVSAHARMPAPRMTQGALYRIRRGVYEVSPKVR
jgi:hypothetical protein